MSNLIIFLPLVDSECDTTITTLIPEIVEYYTTTTKGRDNLIYVAGSNNSVPQISK